MDDVDLRLLRRMYPRALPSGRWEPGLVRPRELAEDVGLTAETVKERLARLARAGVLEGRELRPSVRQLGLEWSAYLYSFPLAGKTDALARLEDVDGVAGYMSFVGEDALVVLAHEDEAERHGRLALVEKLAGARPRTRLSRLQPPATRALTRLDWRIVRSLRADATKGAAQVAEELGVTARTVRDRLARMVADCDVVFLPVLDRGRVGGLFAHVVCHPAPGARDGVFADVVKATAGRRLYAWPPVDGLPFDVGVLAPNAAAAEALRAEVAVIEGVAAAELLVASGGYDNRPMIDARVARRAA